MKTKNWLDQKPQTIRDWLGMAFLCGIFYALIVHLQPILGWLGAAGALLSPFAGAAILAYVLDTLVRPIHSILLGGRPRLRWVAILAAYVLAGLAILLLAWQVLPKVGASVTTFFKNLPYYVENTQKTMLFLQERSPIDLTPLIELLDDYQQLMGSAYNLVTGITPRLAGYLGNVASYALHLVVVVAGSIYMLADKNHLLRQMRMIVRAILPKHLADDVLSICSYANRNFSEFFFGKIFDAVIIGGLLFAGMSLLGLSFAPMISVLVGFCALIPMFGAYIGAIPGLLILLFVDPWQALVLLILLIILQQLDSRVIAPRVLGRTVGVSAFWILFAVVIGGTLLGPIGMVLGVPAFVTLYGLLRGVIYWVLDRRGVTARDLDGTPEPPNAEEEKETATV